MELKEAVQALSEHSKEDVVKAIQADASVVWQHIHDIGFSLSTDKAREKIELVKTELAEAKDSIEEKDKRIEEIEAKQPDLEAERASHKTAVDKLEAKSAKRVAELEKSLADTNRKSVLGALTLELGDLNPVYARVAAQDAMSRVRFAEDGSGDYEVMTQSQTPFITANGKTPIQLLAAELVSDSPKELVASNVDRGTGGKPGDEGGKGGEKPVWDKMREKGKEVGNADKPRQENITKMFGTVQD